MSYAARAQSSSPSASISGVEVLRVGADGTESPVTSAGLQANEPVKYYASGLNGLPLVTSYTFKILDSAGKLVDSFTSRAENLKGEAWVYTRAPAVPGTYVVDVEDRKNIPFVGAFLREHARKTFVVTAQAPKPPESPAGGCPWYNPLCGVGQSFEKLTVPLVILGVGVLAYMVFKGRK